MQGTPSTRTTRPLQWRDIYEEAQLYKAAVRVYTKPLFQWRKALATSTDGKTLYDFAGRGLRGLDAIHRALQRETFEFRPAVGLHYNFNGKHRTLYVAPWEERMVDLLLYRLLSCRLRHWFSPNSYAYRDRNYGLDRCQTRIAAVLRWATTPLYLIKRDIADYFGAINHDLLLDELGRLVDPEDYLFRLLEQRVRFLYQEGGSIKKATCGVPFGTAIACLFANIYLTELDRRIESLPQIDYFRYADDILVLSSNRETAELAAKHLELTLSRLELTMKPSHCANLLISRDPAADVGFAAAGDFRHLGLLFRAGGTVALSRDKLRKIQNLFRFAFRRGRRRWQKYHDPPARALALVTIAAEAIGNGLRNVAILDYYLKHIDEEKQLRMLDRWLAEEILSRVFGGHKRGHFRKITFRRLRALGLPSLVHRRRLIRRGRIDSPFFVWQRQRTTRAFRGTVARPRRRTGGAAFSPVPEAAAGKRS